MSFAFGFTSESFSDDELEGSQQFSTNGPSGVSDTPKINPLDEPSSSFPPEILSFNDLLSSLINTRLTFETIKTPGGESLYRRELFDVKHQLMSEEGTANDSKNITKESTNEILLGLDSSSDLLKNVYEGGFKSWECSIDLVDKFANEWKERDIVGDVLELGCGTALPSCFLFKKLIQSKRQRASPQRLVVTDYNASVLRLVTLPNLIITWAKTLDGETLALLQKEDEDLPIVDDELQLSPSLVNRFVQDLRDSAIDITFISGGWNSEFLHLLNSISTTFEIVYTSETIYSLSTLPVIGELLISLRETNKASNVSAYCAAKDIYFGVGGNIVEFLAYLSRRNDEQQLSLQVDVAKVAGGLQRSIVLIK